MRVIVTAGPTREYIDTVRFITNASSGRMGCALAQAAAEAGHQVTLLLAQSLVPSEPTALTQNITLVPFVTVEDLKGRLKALLADSDALIMAAAVGDFRVEGPASSKLSRSAGPIDLRLLPTEDVVARAGAAKRDDQTIITFALESVGGIPINRDSPSCVTPTASAGTRLDKPAVPPVEDGAVDEAEAKARAEMAAKNADYVVVNTPAAIGSDDSRACILSPSGVVLSWAVRTKQQLAREIVKLLSGP